MSKYLALVAAQQAAEAAFVASNAGEREDKALTAADVALNAYITRRLTLKAEFEKLAADNAVVDMCVCLENAAGCFQDGHTENDVEYWNIAMETARGYINGEF